MSARRIWYPSESLVAELPAAQPTASEAGSDAGSKNNIGASNGSTSSSGATVAKTKAKITRRRTLTVDTNSTRSDSTEKLDKDRCGRGTETTTYSTIENTRTCASTKTLISNLMQCDKPVLSKDSDFQGWLQSDPLLQWRSIFLPKLEHATNRNVKENYRARKHRSEEFVFKHYKDISEYMHYYRKHCSMTSLSVLSLKQSCPLKPNEKPKQDRKSTRPSTRGVFRTVDDGEANQQQSLTENKPQPSVPAQNSNPKLAELENRLNLTASIAVSTSKPLPIMPRPTPPSIVNRESTSIILCGSGNSSSEKLVTITNAFCDLYIIHTIFFIYLKLTIKIESFYLFRYYEDGDAPTTQNKVRVFLAIAACLVLPVLFSSEDC